MIRMAVFDMAGTTIDEDNVVYKVLQRSINEAGFNFSLEAVLAEGAGKEKLQAIKSVLQSTNVTNDKLSGEIFARFQAQLTEAYRTQAIVEQPNATTVFRSLKENNILVVLNTGYNRQTAEALVEKIGWTMGADFDELITASDVEQNRPNPDMILLAMSQLGLTDPSEVLKVGDSTIDIEEGKNASCSLTIGVTTGAHTPEQLRSANPDYIIADLIELLSIVGITESKGLSSVVVDVQ